MKYTLTILFTFWVSILLAQSNVLKSGGEKVTITSSTGAIRRINNQTDTAQVLTTGTSGTDFNINSSGGTHTVNLPVASGTNTGKLSSTDWTTFNGKVGGSGNTNEWAYFSGSGVLSSSNSLINNAGHLNAQNAGSIQMPSRTTIPGQNRALFSRSDMGSNLFYQTPDALVYTLMLGRQFMSNKYLNWTSAVPDIPEIYNIFTGTSGQRWTKSNTGSTSAGGTYVVTYALNTQSLVTPANGGFTYPGGTMYFWFNGSNSPQSISLRFQDASNTWHGPISVPMTNVSTADQGVNNGINFNLYKRQLSSFANYIKTVEITYVAQPAVSISLAGEAYLLLDASDFVNTVGNIIVNDASVQQIYPDLEGYSSTGLGWKLGKDGKLTINNDFRPNNLPGTTGQWLQSAGANNPPIWRDPSALYRIGQPKTTPNQVGATFLLDSLSFEKASFNGVGMIDTFSTQVIRAKTFRNNGGYTATNVTLQNITDPGANGNAGVSTLYSIAGTNFGRLSFVDTVSSSIVNAGFKFEVRNRAGLMTVPLMITNTNGLYLGNAISYKSRSYSTGTSATLDGLKSKYNVLGSVDTIRLPDIVSGVFTGTNEVPIGYRATLDNVSGDKVIVLTASGDIVFNSSATRLVMPKGATWVIEATLLNNWTITKNCESCLEQSSSSTINFDGSNPLLEVTGTGTATINLPEIVSSAPGANQVLIGTTFTIAIDRTGDVTINRGGSSDVFKRNGDTSSGTSIVTTGGTYSVLTFYAGGVDTWYVK